MIKSNIDLYNSCKQVQDNVKLDQKFQNKIAEHTLVVDCLKERVRIVEENLEKEKKRDAVAKKDFDALCDKIVEKKDLEEIMERLKEVKDELNLFQIKPIVNVEDYQKFKNYVTDHHITDSDIVEYNATVQKTISDFITSAQPVSFNIEPLEAKLKEESAKILFLSQEISEIKEKVSQLSMKNDYDEFRKDLAELRELISKQEPQFIVSHLQKDIKVPSLDFEKPFVAQSEALDINAPIQKKSKVPSCSVRPKDRV